MSALLEERVRAGLLDIEGRGLYRELRVAEVGKTGCLNLASNDYLCLSRDERVIEGAREALYEYGGSSSGSPAVASHFQIHEALIESLCEWLGMRYGMLWSSGFAANHNVLKTLLNRDSVVLADRYVHYSCVKGILESGARLVRYGHCDMGELERCLEKLSGEGREIFVVSETLYSMDGDYPDLGKMVALKRKYPYVWIVDEAHGLGWYGERGEGLCGEMGVVGEVDVMIATLGKALASQGAFVLFKEKRWMDYVVNFSKDYLYSTHLAPALVGGALAAVNVIREELCFEQKVWRERAVGISKMIGSCYQTTVGNDSPIQPMVLGDNVVVMRVMEELRREGVLVGAIRPPSVPVGTSRLRLSINRKTTVNEIEERVMPVIRKVLGR